MNRKKRLGRINSKRKDSIGFSLVVPLKDIFLYPQILSNDIAFILEIMREELRISLPELSFIKELPNFPLPLEAFSLLNT